MKWDEANGHSLQAEVCQIRSTREEMYLLFGTQTRAERCIVVTPVLAKQLAVGLRGVLQDYEAGSTSVDATPAGRTASTADVAQVPHAARELFELVQALNIGFGFERSFKLSERSLLADRLILGVRPQLTRRQSLLDICRGIGMPQSQLERFEAELPEANTVGFGFEGSERGGVFKVYLEFWERLRSRMRQGPRNTSPAPLFLGFKWDAGDSAHAAVAHYTCHPLLSVKGIRRRLDALYAGREDSASLRATRAILALAAARIGAGDSFVYVEATEEGNPRASFDINLYKAGLRIGDLKPVLAPLSRTYSVLPEAFEPTVTDAAARPFGHLSGGLGRDGRDFLTVYYELEGL